MIVTVSRQFGSDGETIARSVAASLGLTVIDRETIRSAALQAGIPADLLQRLMYVGQRKVANDILQPLGNVTPDVAATAAGNPLLGVYAPPVSMDAVSLQDAARAVGRIIQAIAGRGNIMILGQGGQMLLQGQPGACHVLFVAPLDLRVANVAKWHGLSAREARRRVRGVDEARSDFLARYYGVRWLDPLLYHLVINTGRVGTADAEALLVRAAQGAAAAGVVSDAGPTGPEAAGPA
jgi:cytidylate kinase